MLSVIITCYYMPQLDMLDSEEWDGGSLETSMQTANHAPTEMHCMGIGVQVLQPGWATLFSWCKGPIPFPTASCGTCLSTINGVNLVSRQRPILSASHGSICWEKEAGKKRAEAGCPCGEGKTICLAVFGRVSPGLMSTIQKLNM